MPLVEWSAELLPENVREHLDFDPSTEDENPDEDKEAGEQNAL